MSAFVVNKSHINAMLQAGMAVTYEPFSWWHDGKRHILDGSTIDEVGQMLLDECVKSVCYRYDDDSMTDLPGRTNAEWLLPFKYKHIQTRPSPLEALKIISCYEYQTCEHDEWETSEAKAFCSALRHCTINRLPGYGDAAGWEWEDEAYYQRQSAVRLIG